MMEELKTSVEGFVTWQFVLSFSLLVAVLAGLVQWLKLPIDKIVMKLFGKECKIPTRFVVYFFALVLLNVGQAFLKIWTWEMFGLNFVNGYIVAATAMKLYESTIEKKIKSG